MTWVAIMYALLTLAWAPHLYSFYKSWRERRNPISLAICLTIFLAAFTNVYLLSTLYDKSSESFQALAYGVCSGAVSVYFYVARRCAAKTFSSDRRN